MEVTISRTRHRKRVVKAGLGEGWCEGLWCSLRTVLYHCLLLGIYTSIDAYKASRSAPACPVAHGQYVRDLLGPGFPKHSANDRQHRCFLRLLGVGVEGGKVSSSILGIAATGRVRHNLLDLSPDSEVRTWFSGSKLQARQAPPPPLPVGNEPWPQGSLNPII